MSATPMADWHRRAGVRVDPRRVLHEDLDRAKAFFPERLIPYLDHEIVRALPPDTVRGLVIHHLYQYLQFTTSFEMRVVNRAAERIATSRLG